MLQISFSDTNIIKKAWNESTTNCKTSRTKYRVDGDNSEQNSYVVRT